jgi:hypothetical protein
MNLRPGSDERQRRLHGHFDQLHPAARLSGMHVIDQALPMLVGHELRCTFMPPIGCGG